MRTTTKEQWLAIKTHDAAWDGRLIYGLKSTRTICRPSCSAHRPTPENIVLFDSLEDARNAGYHPCARCHPELEHWEGAKKELAKAAEAYVRAHYTEKFSLTLLAGALHIDKSYLLRVFKESTGYTLLEFHNRVRCEAAQDLLTRQELSISYIASAVGFVSASHFSQVFRKVTGMTPSQFRRSYLISLDA